MADQKIVIRKYFEEQSIVDSNLESFNNFIENELQKIIIENREIEPTIIPHNVDEFKIRLDKIWVTKPEITEADGSKRRLMPAEARLRKITYAAPCYIEVSSHINGVQRETFTTQIGSIPIMLKSKYCNLYKMPKEELVQNSEDPEDIGGYFIINGTEKVLISVEDLAPNRFIVEKAAMGVSDFTGKIFCEKESYKIPHLVEKLKDGIFYISFTRVKRVPVIIILKALGMTKDEEIMKSVSFEKNYDEVIINLFEFADVKSEEDAQDIIAKKAGITQSKEIRVEKIREILDKYLFPNLGVSHNDRMFKARNLCKMIKKFIEVSNGTIPPDDKDHYINKRLKLSGDLMADLMRTNLKVLIGDLLYNFQRIVKRGKFPSIKVIIRDKLLTQRVYSSMATGSWIGGREGISQRVQRSNFLELISHAQRVVSPLASSQENFAARGLHPTHLGRLCPIETPEGTNIGLRKNLAMLASVTRDMPDEDVLKQLRSYGMVMVR
jgi:DNA-directed RNA polymerase beta subunit